LLLGLSLVKANAFELTLEKAVEVGVTRIIPLIADRSNVKFSKRPDRWARIIIEAAKQSKHYHLPVLDEPTRFHDVLEMQTPSRFVFAERGGGSLNWVRAGAPVLFLVGPEGGWTEKKIERAQQKGFKPVGWGAEILRRKTAAITGAALIL